MKTLQFFLIIAIGECLAYEKRIYYHEPVQRSFVGALFGGNPFSFGGQKQHGGGGGRPNHYRHQKPQYHPHPHPHQSKPPTPQHYHQPTQTFEQNPMKVPHHTPKSYTIIKKIPYEIKVPVPRPVPVKIPVAKPYTVEKKIPVPVKVYVPQPYTVEKRVPYQVKVKVPVPQPYVVERRVPYEVKIPVERPYIVHVPKPYPVYIEEHAPVKTEKPPVPHQMKAKPVPIPLHKYMHGFAEPPHYGQHDSSSWKHEQDHYKPNQDHYKHNQDHYNSWKPEEDPYKNWKLEQEQYKSWKPDFGGTSQDFKRDEVIVGSHDGKDADDVVLLSPEDWPGFGQHDDHQEFAFPEHGYHDESKDSSSDHANVVKFNEDVWGKAEDAEFAGHGPQVFTIDDVRDGADFHQTDAKAEELKSETQPHYQSQNADAFEGLPQPQRLIAYEHPAHRFGVRKAQQESQKRYELQKAQEANSYQLQKAERESQEENRYQLQKAQRESEEENRYQLQKTEHQFQKTEQESQEVELPEFESLPQPEALVAVSEHDPQSENEEVIYGHVNRDKSGFKPPTEMYFIHPSNDGNVLQSSYNVDSTLKPVQEYPIILANVASGPGAGTQGNGEKSGSRMNNREKPGYQVNEQAQEQPMNPDNKPGRYNGAQQKQQEMVPSLHRRHDFVETPLVKGKVKGGPRSQRSMFFFEDPEPKIWAAPNMKGWTPIDVVVNVPPHGDERS